MLTLNPCSARATLAVLCLLQVSFRRMAALNRPELPAAAAGLVGSIAIGLTYPAFAQAFSSLINVLFLTGERKNPAE